MTPPAAGQAGEHADSQRSRVYAAEQLVGRVVDRSVDFPTITVAGSQLTLPPERHFADLPSVQRYVNALLDLPWVRDRYPAATRRRVLVRERHGQSKAHYEFDAATIALPVRGHEARWALRELVVLHEVAHHLGSPDDTGHGPDFTARLIDLVDGVMGPEVALLLRVTFHDEGVAIA